MAENSVWLEAQEIVVLMRRMKGQGALEPGDLIRIRFKEKGFPGMVALNALVVAGHIQMANGDLIFLRCVIESRKWDVAKNRTFIVTAGSTFSKQTFDATVRPYLESCRRVT